MLFIVIGLFFVLFILQIYTNKESFQTKDYMVVCARYNKNTDFLKQLTIPYKVIEKDSVPNVANEATSYLYYILQNYDILPENVIFIHDENESWHHEGKITEKIEEWIQEYEKSGGKYYEFNNMTIEKPQEFHTEAEKELWQKVFEPHICKYSEATPVAGKCCAQFIVSKKQIQKHPKKFYQDYYDWLIENTTAEGNGEASDMYSGYNTSRYAEWSWRFIFSP